MNSLNHYAYGSIAGWMFRYMCGFSWDENGQLRIAPMLDQRIGFAEGQICTGAGVCKSSWHYEPDGILYTFEIPFGESADIIFPDGEKVRLTTGAYRFKKVM